MPILDPNSNSKFYIINYAGILIRKNLQNIKIFDEKLVHKILGLIKVLVSFVRYLKNDI